MWKLYVVFPNSHPHSQYMKIPFFLHPCQHLSFVFFDDGPSDSCEMISHCGSDLHLLDDCTSFHGCLHFLKFWKTLFGGLFFYSYSLHFHLLVLLGIFWRLCTHTHLYHCYNIIYVNFKKFGYFCGKGKQFCSRRV